MVLPFIEHRTEEILFRLVFEGLHVALLSGTLTRHHYNGPLCGCVVFHSLARPFTADGVSSNSNLVLLAGTATGMDM